MFLSQNPHAGRPSAPCFTQLTCLWHADLLYGSKSGVFQYNQALNITTRTADGVVRSHDPPQPMIIEAASSEATHYENGGNP